MSYIDRIKLNAFETRIRGKRNYNGSNYINEVKFNDAIFPMRENNSEYKYMSVTIDLTNSNPETCCQYRDDALSMIAGSSNWDEFFGHFPCTLNESTKEVKKLNPNNFAKYKDGSNRDNELDTMICFPLRGINIFRVSHYLTVSMTDNPNDDAYQYYAHTYKGIIRKNMYISAYRAETSGLKVVSKSGENFSVSSNQFNLPNMKTRCNNKGFGYDVYGWYQYIYLQVMYILKYCNLDSQKTIGRGLVNSMNANLNVVYVDTTGETDQYGMDSEIKRNEEGSDFTYCTENKEEMRQKTVYHSKLFGIEDLWGSRWTILDNVRALSNKEIYVCTTSGNTIDSEYCYNKITTLGTSNKRGWLKIPYGNNELGFLADNVSTIPNTSINFTDENTINLKSNGNTYIAQSGYPADLNSAGIFLIGLQFSSSTEEASFRFCCFEN